MGANRVKEGMSGSRVVAVIASASALVTATRLCRPPDLFELRLDRLRHSLELVDRAIPKLRAPLILTARHPAEGGRGTLRADARQALLERFLEHAAFIDIELRSIKQMRGLIQAAQQRRVGLILSWHDLNGRITVPVLRRKVICAASAGATIFKVATRTETPAELARVISLFQKAPRKLPIAAMGIGKLGRVSRIQLDQLSSALTYVALGEPAVAGQPSLSQLRRHRSVYGI